MSGLGRFWCTISVADRSPACMGWNCTPIVQVAARGNERRLRQSSALIWKSPAAGPSTLGGGLTTRDTEPVLLIVITEHVVAWPTAVAGQTATAGSTLMPGPEGCPVVADVPLEAVEPVGCVTDITGGTVVGAAADPVGLEVVAVTTPTPSSTPLGVV